MSQNYIAEKIGYSSQLVYSWEKGKSLPYLSIVVLLCNCLQITIEDFFTASKQAPFYELSPFDLEVFAYNLKKLRVINNYTQHELADKLKVSYNTVIAWKKGKSTPSLNQFILLKQLYNTTFTDLYYGIYEVKQKNKYSKNNKKKSIAITLPILAGVVSISIILGIIYLNNRNSITQKHEDPMDNPEPPIEDPDPPVIDPDPPIDDPVGKTFLATFVDEDKETIIWSHEFNENDNVYYGAKVPDNKEDDIYNKLFLGWDYNKDGIVDDINIKIDKDMTFVAVYNYAKKSELVVEKFVIRQIYNEVSIQSYSGNENNVVIPNYVNGLQITKIEGSAFYNNYNIESLVIPDGISFIGGDCFESCINLKKVIFPSNMESIGSDAFKDCWSLEEIIMPTTINNIYNHAFENCTSLTSFYFPNNIKTICEGVLSGCKNIKNINFNEEISIIKDSAFKGTGIESIELPSTLTTLGSFVFLNCDNLKMVKLNENSSNSLQIGDNLYSVTMKNVDTIIPKCTKYWKLSKNYVSFSTLDSWHFFYCGTQEDFKNINFIGDYTYGCVENKHIYFYNENKQDQCWRYLDGVPTIY